MTVIFKKISRTLLILLGITVLIGCGSDDSSQSIYEPTQKTEQFSLFESSDTQQKTNQYSYQSVYPGDTIDPESVKIGLDAAMSGDFAKSGVSIWRGMVLAVDEINNDGGLLGKKLQIVVKDHRANPTRGLENIREFSSMDRLLAVMGGMHTPVMLHELSAIHEKKIISLVPWAAGTPIVDNGYEPNYVFRLSCRDEYAGRYLVKKLVEAGYETPALFLEKTGWGRSNKEALTEVLQRQGLSPAMISFFNWSKKTFRDEIKQANAKQADIIVFVGNAPEGTTLVQSMAERNKTDRLPILSHRGITGGTFFEKTRSILPDVQLRVLQTRSFLDPADTEYARTEIEAYCENFDCPKPNKNHIFAPAGTAHAHDLVHLFGQAVRKANSIDRSKIQNAMEELEQWQGVVRKYESPFSSKDHEALTIDDLRLTRYNTRGSLVIDDLD